MCACALCLGSQLGPQERGASRHASSAGRGEASLKGLEVSWLCANDFPGVTKLLSAKLLIKTLVITISGQLA